MRYFFGYGTFIIFVCPKSPNSSGEIFWPGVHLQRLAVSAWRGVYVWACPPTMAVRQWTRGCHETSAPCHTAAHAASLVVAKRARLQTVNYRNTKASNSRSFVAALTNTGSGCLRGQFSNELGALHSSSHRGQTIIVVSGATQRRRTALNLHLRETMRGVR